MDRHPILASRARLGLRATLATACAAVAFTFAMNTQAVTVSSDFETGIDGWLGYSCPNPGNCTGLSPGGVAVNHVLGGGSPIGGGAPETGNNYIDTVDPGEDFAARVEPNPTKYGSLYAVGVTLSFDALVRSNGGGGVYDFGNFGPVAPLVAVESPLGMLVYATSDLPEIDGPWKHYSVPLVNGAAWFLATNQGFANSTVEQFALAIGNMTRLTLISEWLKEVQEIDTGGIDNFQVVPIPAALPLLGSAMLLFVRLGRRTLA